MEEKSSKHEKAQKILDQLPVPENVKALRLLRMTNPKRYWIFIFATFFGLVGLICAASYIITLLTGWPFGLTVALLTIMRYIFT